MSKDSWCTYALGVMSKRNLPSGFQDLCRKLKDQLEELEVEMKAEKAKVGEDIARRGQLMERLKAQLSELSN